MFFFVVYHPRLWYRIFQVVPEAFEALVECIAEGDFDKCEQVPAGDENGFLIQPIGGIAVDMAGPARCYAYF